MDSVAPTFSVNSRQNAREWTALRSRSLGGTPASWTDYNAPDELNLLPDTLKVPPKLADIVRWSLQRPAALQASRFETPSTNIGAERQPSLQAAPRSRSWSRSRDRAETCSIRSDARSQTSSTFGRAVPKLQKMKNDLIATAASKITVLKKHEPDGAAASKTPKIATATTETTKTGECTSCFEELPIGALVRLPCTHHYCKPCLASLVMTALQNESAFPPKCCLSEIPQATIIVPLDKKQQETYKQKAAEYSIPANRRWYCPNTKCLKWIPPYKLHRSRMTSQKCPHCHIKICGMCRGAAHDRHVDCPQDFGLEATINIAESEGWRRCHNCRTMVERATGCRHITCKCGAEFCYVCGSRWRTCACTEVDEANRQAALRRQRLERDAVDQAEADEVARAIAVVEALVRSEAEARRQREEEEERQRQLEEAELARLEQIRLEEEAARQRKEEEAEQQLRAILRLSIQEDFDALLAAVRELLHVQHITLDDRHGAEEQKLMATFEKTNDILTKNAKMLQQNMQKNVARRIEQLKSKQEQEIRELQQAFDEQEDDLFIQIQAHLHGKPNREAREKTLVEGMQTEQGEKKKQMENRHEGELAALQGVASMELEGLKRSGDLRRKRAMADYESNVEKLLIRAGIERRWFETIWARRLELVDEHGRMMICDFEASREPHGLTEQQASDVLPLPARRERARDLPPVMTVQDHQVDSIQTTPVELEAPIIPPTIRRKPVATSVPIEEAQMVAAARDQDRWGAGHVNTRQATSTSPLMDEEYRRATSSDSFTTAQTHASVDALVPEISNNPWAWAMGPAPMAPQVHGTSIIDQGFVSNGLPDSLRAGRPMTTTQHARHLTPPSPIRNDVQELMPLPHNGKAYLSVKNSESSQPMDGLAPARLFTKPKALPTPPESPLTPQHSWPRSTFPQSNVPSAHRPSYAPRPENRLNLRIPSRISGGENSIDTTVTATSTSQATSKFSRTLPQVSTPKPRRSLVPQMTGTMYMDMFLDVPEPRNKAPADVLSPREDNGGSFNASLPSLTAGEGQKKRRWLFRKDQYIEKVKARVEKAVGDASA